MSERPLGRYQPVRAGTHRQLTASLWSCAFHLFLPVSTSAIRNDLHAPQVRLEPWLQWKVEDEATATHLSLEPVTTEAPVGSKRTDRHASSCALHRTKNLLACCIDSVSLVAVSSLT